MRPVEGLQDQVVRQKRRIERRVAIVHHFEIDRHHRSVIHQEILGAPVAMHQGNAAGARFLNEALKEQGQSWMALGRRSIVRIEPQLIEDGLAGEPGFPIGPLAALADHTAEHLADSGRYARIDVAPKQQRFPGLRALRRRRHGKDAVRLVLKEDTGNRFRRKMRAEGFHRRAFPMNARAVREPVLFHPQFLQRLFQDKTLRSALYQQHCVGYAAAELANLDRTRVRSAIRLYIFVSGRQSQFEQVPMIANRTVGYSAPARK